MDNFKNSGSTSSYPFDLSDMPTYIPKKRSRLEMDFGFCDIIAIDSPHNQIEEFHQDDRRCDTCKGLYPIPEEDSDDYTEEYLYELNRIRELIHQDFETFSKIYSGEMDLEDLESDTGRNLRK